MLGGVQRQYSGTLGKTANCQLGVSVNAVCKQASCPLNWRLFLPEPWDDAAMATRRAACHLPAAVHHRPKWRLVLDMLDELAGWELSPPVLVADCGYGEIGEFRGGLDTREIPYVVEVRSATSAYAEQVRPTTAPYTGERRRPRPRYHDKPSSLASPALQAGQQACVELIWRRAARACNAAASWCCGSARRGHPRAARHEQTGPSCRCTGCWWSGPQVSPRPSSTGCPTCPRRRRWSSWSAWPGCGGESSRTRELKGMLGLDHFEGRGFGGWHHHMTLVSVAHGFLILERLRPNLVASA